VVHFYEALGVHGHFSEGFITDLKGSYFHKLLGRHGASDTSDQGLARAEGSTIIDRLPRDPRHVLVEDLRFGGKGDIYLVDVYTDDASKVMAGTDRFGAYQLDLNGVIRARQTADFDNGKVYNAHQVRDPQTGAWEEIFRDYAKDRTTRSIVSFTSDPNVVLISSTEGGDKVGIYEFDIQQKKVIEPAFQHKMFEAGSIVRSSDDKDFGRVLGFTYEADTQRIYWVDDHWANIAKALDKALGVTTSPVAWTDPGTGLRGTINESPIASVSIGSKSRDGKYMIVVKEGPKQPPQYYLLTDGAKLTALGKARPTIDPAALGDTHLIEYPARDGLMIPAFLTTPPKDVFGPGPYPTLIEPHGGPWARDYMEWDPIGWVQYFASRGYAVLQPQFRGSEGWGQKLWRAGDAEWGQKMADDNDDGVKYLISQHIADPNRVAMFGYSYGGYAALAAAIRPNGLYQCTISGAGAGDLKEIANATNDNRYEKEFQHPTIAGLDPLTHAADVKIPVMLFHGDRDRTVDIRESREFVAKLRAAGKTVEYLEIKDMGHQYVLMTPAMAAEELTAVDHYLKTGCKAGGL
jgi:dipeptidyl aminopeptidase/acylaminoacyl peptidase